MALETTEAISWRSSSFGSVLMEGVEVEKNVRIEGSIVGERAKVEEGSQVLELTIVDHGEIIERGSQLRSIRLPETAD